MLAVLREEARSAEHTAPDENLSFSNLQWDWGFGTRFKTYRDIVLRLEVAFSDETTRYYFRGSTSF